jgi:hypothetical protein
MNTLRDKTNNFASLEIIVAVRGSTDEQRQIGGKADQLLSQRGISHAVVNLSSDLSMADGRWNYHALMEAARRKNAGGLLITGRLLGGATDGTRLLSVSHDPNGNAIQESWVAILKILSEVDGQWRLTSGVLTHKLDEAELAGQQT